MTDIKNLVTMLVQGMLAHPTRYRPREGAPANWHDAIVEEAVELALAIERAVAAKKVGSSTATDTKTLSGEQIEEFKALTGPLMKWLNDNHNPHTTIIVTPTSAEVVSGVLCYQTTEFVND